MSDFELLLNKLLEQKPELTKEQVEERIKQKKDKIGAGYLTDQGALFLIASDLGISLGEPLKVEMGLKDLFVGAKEVSLETRVLNFSPAKQFSRKDGTPFFLRTMTVYDNDSTASVKLWDEKANLQSIENLKPGDLVKIIKAYVKSDLNGSPTINVGSGSTIESSKEPSTIPSIKEITKDVSEVKEGENNIVVSGILEGTINQMEFTNSRGQPGKALRFRMKGKDEKFMRVVLWGKDDSSIPKVISSEAKMTLLGVRSKTGLQDLELHGNESTIIQMEGNQEIEPVIVRILSVSESDSGKTLILGIDSKKNFIKITDLAENAKVFVEGDVVECMPSQIFGDSLTIDDNSFVRKIQDEFTIPTLTEIRTKISDVNVGGDYCIEAIILKIPERREVQTKSGETISLGEMFIEDDTGQIWLKGWRNQSRLIENCSIGEIVAVTGVTARSGLEGRIELFLTPFSKIFKKN